MVFKSGTSFHKNKYRLPAVLAGFFLIFILAYGCDYPGPPQAKKTHLYQIGTIEKLKQGNFDGIRPLEILPQNSAVIGLGTIDGLDGELVIVSGNYYQVNGKGSLVQMEGARLSPFASAVVFTAPHVQTVDEPMTLATLPAFLLSQFDDKGRPYAIRVSGKFTSLVTRSIDKQVKPYRDLKTTTSEQKLFLFNDRAATLVGFYAPDSFGGQMMAGLHLHGITADGLSGGHVLDFSSTSLTVEWLPIEEATFYLQ